MKISAESLDVAATYRLLTGVVVPRPIAWVTTLSSTGVVNLAPFSAFTFVSTDPPMVGFTAGRRDGALKDTARNIHERGEYVVHIADAALVDPLHMSAEDFPSEVSEAEALGLAVEPCDVVSVPRLSAAPIALECVFVQAVPFGRRGGEFLVGEIRLFHVRDGLISNGKIDTRMLNPIGRLAGPVYGTIGTIISKQASASYAKLSQP